MVSHSKTALGDGSPTRIGKYPVLGKLGEGATSEVFLARDEFRNHDVAIKLFRPDPGANPMEARIRQRFFAAEAALVDRLQHPNVVRIFDAVADDDAPYLVMEYVPGSTLRRFCRSDALLSLEQIVEIGFKCAMALDYVYRLGLIHRDIKPANLLATLDGDQVTDVKVSDFGSVLNLTADRTQVFRVGSLAYMSPEQLDGDEIDCRADIYALGAVLYHLIAGRPPFDATTQVAIMNQIFTSRQPRLTTLREGVSTRFESLIDGTLAKSRGDRPGDWREFAEALAALVSDRDVPLAALQEVRDSQRFKQLRTLEFFAGFGDVEIWEVVHRAKWECLPSGHALYRSGEEGQTFHIISVGTIKVYRGQQCVATLGSGTSVGEMAYLAPNPSLRVHSADIIVVDPVTCISFTPETLEQLSLSTRLLFDKAFIKVLVRRLHAAHEALAHPRRVL